MLLNRSSLLPHYFLKESFLYVDNFCITRNRFFWCSRSIVSMDVAEKRLTVTLLLFGVFFVGFIISALGTVVFEHTWYGWADITVGLALGFGSFAANGLLHKGFSVGKGVFN